MYNFCSITEKVTSNVGALPSPWLAALANSPGEEVPLPEALVRAEDVRGDGTAGAHPQGDWNLLSWVTCGGTARENELATYRPSPSSAHNRKPRQQVWDSWVPQGYCFFATCSITILCRGRIETVICLC